MLLGVVPVPPGVVGVEGTVGVSVAGGECAGRSCVVRLRIGGGLGRGAAARLRGRLALRWCTVEGFLVVMDEARRAVSVGIAAGARSGGTGGGGAGKVAPGAPPPPGRPRARRQRGRGRRGSPRPARRGG